MSAPYMASCTPTVDSTGLLLYLFNALLIIAIKSSYINSPVSVFGVIFSEPRRASE